MKNKISSLWLIIAMCMFLLGGCKSKSDLVNPQNPFIDAYTGGIISIESTILVRMIQEIPNAEPGEKVEGKIFTFSPNIDGETYYADAYTIEFRPKEHLKSGTEYEATFNVGKIVKEAEGKDKKFTFMFATSEPAFSIDLDGLSLQDEMQPDNFILSGRVLASDFMHNEKVESTLEATFQGKTTEVKWSHRPADRVHEFTIENIAASDKEQELLLHWNGKAVGYDYKTTDTILIPEKGAFKVLDIKVNTGESYVECRFSAPLNEKQRFESFINLSGGGEARYKASSNILYIYYSNKESGSCILTIRKELSSKEGKQLPEDYTQEITIEEIKPAVRLIGKGIIIPSSEGLTLPFQAVNLSAVDVEIHKTYESNVLQFLQVNRLDGSYELRRVAKPIAHKTIRLAESRKSNLHQWNTFSIDLASIITPEPGAIYNVKIKFSRNYSLYRDCEENNAGKNTEQELVSASSYEDGDEEYDDDDYYYYSWEDRDNPCKDGYYNYNRFISQNVLATDLGVIVKRGSDKMLLAFVNNIVTTKPMSGVKVTAYDYQQQKVGEGSTDSEGKTAFEINGTAYVVVASYEKQKNYVRVDDGASLSLSNFDVSGEELQKGLKGFIYGERGVWRPGDTIFLTFVLDDRLKQLPAKHPVNFELYNAQSQLVNQQVKVDGQNGFYTFAYQTDAEAPTGSWNAVVRVGGAAFYKSLRVATIKPNRLKITTTLDNELVPPGKNISGSLEVKWLHGATAGGLATDIKTTVTEKHTTFKGFENYIFDDVTKRFWSDGEQTYDGHLNADGEMNFSIPLETNKRSPGMLQASLAIRVFEEGGEFSSDNAYVSISPYTSYVGLKVPDGEGYYRRLETGKNQLFEVAAVNYTGKAVSKKLNVEIYRNEWSWWWYSSDGKLANFSQSSYQNALFTTTVKTDANGKASFNYKLDYPDWGQLLVKVTDPESGHSATQFVYIDWSSNRSTGSNTEGANMLSFKSDKEKYNVGEKAVITIPSSEGARALVSVENSAKVISSFWVECKAAETQITVPTTTEMLPNAYVHITLLQPHAQTKNDLPIRLYGIIPLLVEDPATHLNPVITMPEVIRPEQGFSVKVAEKNSKEMTYTLAIVDDGLLDLTRFKTPDPWNYFFAREALGVKTWDMYNYVLGAYGGKIEQIFAIGGDEELSKEGKDSKAQRFKPVVRFAGPFTVKAGKSMEHKFTINNYVGSVRVMVIAGNTAAYGSADKTVPVRSPLMVQATLPRVLGPGEEVLLPATIFAMEKQVKNVKVELKADDMFDIMDGSSKNLTFNNTGDEVVKFRLKVKNKLGIARVKVIATSGNERAENEIEIDVRASNPKVLTTEEKILQGNTAGDISIKLPGMEGTNTAQIEVSSVPSLNLGSRMAFLLAYPHGCLEQTTSAVFPQLYLSEVVDMSPAEKHRAETNVKTALNRLRNFVRPNGGFSYWPGGDYVSDWSNNYAGHFMVEAERKGFAIPPGMKDKWLAAQKNAARSWTPYVNKYYYYTQDDFTQAYRLYLLALAKAPELGAMNRLKERTELSVQAKWMLAGAYVLAGQPETGKKLVDKLSDDVKPYSGSSDTYGSADRDHAMILEVLLLLGEKEKSFLMAQRISKALNSNTWMSTQTTAYCLMALSKYAKDQTGGLDFNYTVNGKSDRVKNQKTIWNLDLGKQAAANTSAKIENKGKNTLFVRLTAQGIPAVGQEQAAENDLKLKVRYLNDRNQEIDVATLTQGSDFVAEVSITNPGKRGYYTNLALTQIFPSGWEITEDRLNDTYSGDGVTYRDIRDDRVYAYFDLSETGTIRVRVKLAAAYVGKFYLPAVGCEAMYDATISANTTGRWVEVVKP